MFEKEVKLKEKTKPDLPTTPSGLMWLLSKLSWGVKDAQARKHLWK